MSQQSSESGPGPSPIPPPRNPLHDPSPTRDVFAALAEKVIGRLDQARAEDARARGEMHLPGAKGESLDGGVEVEVDRQGLITAVRYTGVVMGLTEDQLRDHTLAALRNAQDSLSGQRVSGDALSQLHDRSVATTILDISRREKQQ